MPLARLLCAFVVFALATLPSRSQNVNPMHPQEIEVQKHASPDDLRARVANLQFQKDAKELSDLCASIPDEMVGLKQGLLSRGLTEKLKRMEKLSKQVREQLTRISSQ